MKLAGDQLVLDTNILLHWLRGKAAGAKLRADYSLGTRSPRPILPLVVKGEIKSLAEISSEPVVTAYARLDHESRKLGRRMGKNDLWIAAVAAVQGAVILTTDKDFDHLHTGLVRVEWVDVATLARPGS